MRIEEANMTDEKTISASDVIPGGVIYNKVNVHSGVATARIQLLKTANVRVTSETGAKSAGGNGEANHKLRINGKELDVITAQPGFNAWNGTVATVMIFEAGKWYDLIAEQWNLNADAINTDLKITVVMV